MTEKEKFLSWKIKSLEIGRKVKTGWCSSEVKYVQILKNVNGYARSGECLAIMGGSGAGKSTMLNIISGRFKPNKLMKFDREIKLNGLD